MSDPNMIPEPTREKKYSTMSTNSEISVSVTENEITQGQEVHGRIELNYIGRFDSIVINSHIENSNDIFSYTSLNGRTISYPYARLSIFREDIGNTKTLEFTAITQHTPATGYTNAKFRVAII